MPVAYGRKPSDYTQVAWERSVGQRPSLRPVRKSCNLSELAKNNRISPQQSGVREETPVYTEGVTGMLCIVRIWSINIDLCEDTKTHGARQIYTKWLVQLYEKLLDGAGGSLHCLWRMCESQQPT